MKEKKTSKKHLNVVALLFNKCFNMNTKLYKCYANTTRLSSILLCKTFFLKCLYVAISKEKNTHTINICQGRHRNKNIHTESERERVREFSAFLLLLLFLWPYPVMFMFNCMSTCMWWWYGLRNIAFILTTD